MADYDKENRSKDNGGSHYRHDNHYKENRYNDNGHHRGDKYYEGDRGHRCDGGYSQRDRQRSDYRDNRGRNEFRDQRRRNRSRSRSRSRERHHHHRRREFGDQPPQKQNWPEYYVKEQKSDERLGDTRDDPRGDNPTKRITKKAKHRGSGRNTESFDPASTLVRPSLRIHVGQQTKTFHRVLKHDDVVIVPELFGSEDNWDTYYKLIEEMREIQSKDKASEAGDSNKNKSNKSADWVSWAEGAHLLTKHPEKSPTFNKIIDRLCEYFNIRKQSIGTRFNWYRDSADWKPFHHDSAAFNPQRARTQNITVGASFGSLRELAFLHATENVNGDKTKIYFPQGNNGVFSFGRDANILWKHGINALAPEQQDGKGRISIILWGMAQDVVEEDGSPPLLGSDGKGPHAGGNGDRNRHRGRNNRNRNGHGQGGR